MVVVVVVVVVVAEGFEGVVGFVSPEGEVHTVFGGIDCEKEFDGDDVELLLLLLLFVLLTLPIELEYLFDSFPLSLATGFLNCLN